MSGHTKGRVETLAERGRTIISKSGVLICDMHGSDHTAILQADNAARIVACWNACEGISTEQLKSDHMQGYEPWGHVKHLEAKRDALRAQVDTLQALCQHVIAMADDAYLTGHPEWCVIADEAQAALQSAQKGG